MTDVSAGSGLTLELLAGDIKARVAAGDREADKAEQHYLAAGIHLIEAKARIEAGELPGERWFVWSCRATGYGPDRISQLLRIGRGETTQSELNAARAESERRNYQPAPRQWTDASAAENFTDDLRDLLRRNQEEIERQNAARTAAAVAEALAAAEAERNASAETLRETATAAERMSQMRARRRAERVANGADLPPPLAPIEHRRLLKEGREILGRLDFDQLKAAVAALRDPPTPAPEIEPVEVSQVQSEGLLDVFGDPAVPLRDKIVASVKFCLMPAEQKAALDAVGIADPTVRAPDLEDVWANTPDHERSAFFDLMQIAPEHRPWHYQPAAIAAVPIVEPPTFRMQRAIAALRGLIANFYDGVFDDDGKDHGAKMIENALAADDDWMSRRIERMIEVVILEAPANVEMKTVERRARRVTLEPVAEIESVEVVASVDPVPEPELDRSKPWTFFDTAEPVVETPKERADRRRARKSAQRMAA